MNIFKWKPACAIGIIGGADGPMAMLYGRRKSRKKERELQKFLDYAATQVTANFRPFAEVEDLLVTKYKAVPYVLQENELRTLKANVIINCFPEVLDLPVPLPQNPTKKQILEYAKNDTRFEQAKNYPAEKLGLLLKAYQLPSETDKKGVVELEMTTGYMTICNASEKVGLELSSWSGISQEDIDQRSMRFISYVTTLRDLGKLHFKK